MHWAQNRMSFNSSPGYFSSSSSDYGDEPITPITPVHHPAVDPFSAASKENIAPVHVVHGKAPGKPSVHAISSVHGLVRPALHAINSMDDQIVPGRNMRRLSN
jgi:hypothetical protein